jgi:hypothetical protein
VLGPAKSIMHNMNYKSFYLFKHLLFEFNSALRFMKYTHNSSEKNTQNIHYHICVCVCGLFPLETPSAQLFLNWERCPQTLVRITSHLT